MDLCVHAPDRRRLDLLAASPDLRLGEAPWAAQLDPPTRLLFGVEFCQHLLPSPEDVAAAAALCRERGLGLTLLTSYVTDEFLERSAALVAVVAEEGPDPEVVVNDWGLLRRVRREHPEVGLVLGRGLNRQVRDPRLPDVGPEHLGGDEPPAAWGSSSAGSAAFRALLRKLGVSRVASDVPLQGALPIGDDGLPGQVHLPWGMVASGRICMVNAYGKPPSVRLVPPLACDAPCRRYTLHLRAPWTRREQSDALPVPEGSFIPLTKLLNRRRNALPSAEADPAPRFWQKGNTHFYRLQDEALDRALDWARAEPSIDRVVVELDLPM